MHAQSKLLTHFNAAVLPVECGDLRCLQHVGARGWFGRSASAWSLLYRPIRAVCASTICLDPQRCDPEASFPRDSWGLSPNETPSRLDGPSPCSTPLDSAPVLRGLPRFVLPPATYLMGNIESFPSSGTAPAFVSTICLMLRISSSSQVPPEEDFLGTVGTGNERGSPGRLAVRTIQRNDKIGNGIGFG